MKVLKSSAYFALGFVIATVLVSLTGVGAQVSEGIGRVFIANDAKNPIPIVSKDPLKIKGEVEIDGNPKVRLDDDTKIKIQSVEKPVSVRFEKNEDMPETNIFNTGDKYNIRIAGDTSGICDLDKIRGTWIYCEQNFSEGEIGGWVNTAQIVVVSKLKS